MKRLFAALPLAAACLAAPGFAQDRNLDFAARAAALYTEAPDIEQCRAGRLRPEVITTLTARVNEVRALHGLAPVTSEPAAEDTAVAAALVFAANGSLSHYPGSWWRCFSEAGATGARLSNIFGGLASERLIFVSMDEMVTGWMTDVRHMNPGSIGHRRWLLDPFLASISFGRVAGILPDGRRTDGAALRVIGSNRIVPAPIEGGFIAYPFGDYPARFWDPRALLSFSVLVDLRDKTSSEQVDYARAQVSVRQRGGSAIEVGRVSFDNNAYGLPNSLQFAAEGLQPGATYDVAIRNVSVQGQSKDFAWSFRITP
ncbi:CAP domain-containing protein [Brevundimonas sp.]|uniref:CAP domain-containing protein n=1 Tax=Brevundimonas sp. TaxID=1871086 RepID=UPI003D1171DD